MANELFNLKVDAKMTIDQAGIQKTIGKGSPVDQLTQQKAGEILEAARGLIGTTYSGQHPGPGRLRDSGRVEPDTGTQGVSWSVIFHHPAALYHHEGTRGHGVAPHGNRLFRDGDGSPVSSYGALPHMDNTIFDPGPGKSVHHPGTTGNPYLVNAARQVGLTVRAPSLSNKTEVVATIRVPRSLR